MHLSQVRCAASFEGCHAQVKVMVPAASSCQPAASAKLVLLQQQSRPHNTACSKPTPHHAKWDVCKTVTPVTEQIHALAASRASWQSCTYPSWSCTEQ